MGNALNDGVNWKFAFNVVSKREIVTCKYDNITCYFNVLTHLYIYTCQNLSFVNEYLI